MHSINIEPTDLSFPIRRRRSFSIGVSLATMVWVGPSSDAYLQGEFRDTLRRTVELSGDVFFAASALEVQGFVETRAKRRKVGLPESYKGVPMSEFLHLMVSRTAVERKEIYDSLHDEMGGLGGAFVVDLEQSAHASTPGAIAPSMKTHSEHYSYESKRLAIDEEYLLMQGVDAHPRFRGSRGESPPGGFLQGLGLELQRLPLLGWQWHPRPSFCRVVPLRHGLHSPPCVSVGGAELGRRGSGSGRRSGRRR